MDLDHKNWIPSKIIRYSTDLLHADFDLIKFTKNPIVKKII